MSTCPQCGNNAPTGETVCPHDGAFLVQTAGAAAEPPDIVVDSGELAPGTQVGEYQVTGKLGEGGMGMVFAGIHPLIGKQVAIKVLAPEMARSPDAVRRFVTEARAVNKIGHRNIVDIFSFGQLPDGRHYFVMELLAGETLSARLARDKALSFDVALPILVQMCDALAAAHAKGIVHRDLKPENVYLAAGATPFVKLLDFGIAKLIGEQTGSSNRTRPGLAIGTPQYMSPEQCRSLAIDHRTDIYSLGVVAYEMLAGCRPFLSNNYQDMVNAHIHEPPPPFPEERQVAPNVACVVFRAMAKAPRDRYQTMSQLSGALQKATRIHETTTLPDPALLGLQGRAAGQGRHGRGKRFAIGISALVLVGGAFAWFVRPSAPRPTPPSAAAPVEPTVLPARAVGTLMIDCSEPSAEVEIDGAKKGPASQSFPLTVDQTHAVVVSKTGYLPFTANLTIAATDPLHRLKVELKKVESQPAQKAARTDSSARQARKPGPSKTGHRPSGQNATSSPNAAKTGNPVVGDGLKPW